MKVVVDGLQSTVLPQAVEHGHYWVAMLPTLALQDGVSDASVVLPKVLGNTAAELADEGQHWLPAILCRTRSHCPLTSWWCSGSPRDSVRHTLATCSGGKCVLKRCGGLLHVGGNLLSHCASHQPPDHVTNHNASDHTSWLLQSCHRPHPHSFDHQIPLWL